MILKDKTKPTYHTQDYIDYINKIFTAVRNHPDFERIQHIRFTPPRGSFEYEWYQKQLKKEGKA